MRTRSWGAFAYRGAKEAEATTGSKPGKPSTSLTSILCVLLVAFARLRFFHYSPGASGRCRASHLITCPLLGSRQYFFQHSAVHVFHGKSEQLGGGRGDVGVVNQAQGAPGLMPAPQAMKTACIASSSRS